MSFTAFRDEFGVLRDFVWERDDSDDGAFRDHVAKDAYEAEVRSPEHELACEMAFELKMIEMTAGPSDWDYLMSQTPSRDPRTLLLLAQQLGIGVRNRHRAGAAKSEFREDIARRFKS